MKCYIVFCTTKNWAGEFNDEYEIVDGKYAARRRYEDFLALDDLYCAGWARLKEGTEPQWSTGV